MSHMLVSAPTVARETTAHQHGLAKHWWHRTCIVRVSNSFVGLGSRVGKPIVRVGPRFVNPRDGNFDFGLCRMVQTYTDFEPIGWEIQCSHPLHAEDGQCRLHRQSVTRTRDEEGTIRLLLHWACLGQSVDTHHEHMNDMKLKAEADLASGAIPAEFEPITAFFNSSGVEVHGRKRPRASG